MKIKKTGSVYIWWDKKRTEKNPVGRYYIGSRLGSIDNYISSSKSMLAAYKERPQDFKRKILATNMPDRQERPKEIELLKKVKKKGQMGKKYYNLHIPGEKFLPVEKHSEETKRKMSMLGKQNHLGKREPEETRRKKSEALIGIKRSEETKEKNRQSHIGKHHSEETKQKVSQILLGNKRHLGIKHSEETKEKMSQARKIYWSEKRGAIQI